LTKDQLDEMIDDDFDLEDDEFMKEYRDKRMAEMKAASEKLKFGKVFEISKPDWEQHVTRAPKDVQVVIMFYQSYSTEAQILEVCIDTLAKKYPTTKFIKAVATQVVENFRDEDVPSLFFYKNG